MQIRVLGLWLGLHQAAAMIWDFGSDVRGTSTIAETKGRIPFWGIQSRIDLTVPSCMDVKYVHVKVFNDHLTPAVTYNKHTHTVYINFEKRPDSYSKYEILATGKRKRRCNEGNMGGGGRSKRPSGQDNYPNPSEGQNFNRPGGRPFRPVFRPFRPRGRPFRPRGRPFRPGVRPFRPRGRPFRPGVRPFRPGGRPYRPEVRPYHRGGRPFRPGGNNKYPKNPHVRRAKLVPSDRPESRPKPSGGNTHASPSQSYSKVLVPALFYDPEEIDQPRINEDNGVSPGTSAEVIEPPGQVIYPEEEPQPPEEQSQSPEEQSQSPEERPQPPDDQFQPHFKPQHPINAPPTKGFRPRPRLKKQDFGTENIVKCQEFGSDQHFRFLTYLW